MKRSILKVLIIVLTFVSLTSYASASYIKCKDMGYGVTKCEEIMETYTCTACVKNEANCSMVLDDFHNYQEAYNYARGLLNGKDGEVRCQLVNYEELF